MARPGSNRREVPADTRRTRRAANAAAGAVAAVVALSLSTTQVGEVRAIVPWADDPYDAVTWFSLLLLAVVVAATGVRSARYRGAREIPPAARRRIHRGVGLAVAAVFVTVASDTVALAGLGMPESPPVMASIVVLLLAVTAATAVAAAGLLLDAVRSTAPVAPGPAEADAIDETLALIRDGSALLRRRARRASRALHRGAVATASFLEGSRLSPRRHRALAVFLVAVAGGVAAIGWHMLVEGPWASPVAAAVFGGLAAGGILVIVGGLSGYLRLVRPA